MSAIDNALTKIYPIDLDLAELANADLWHIRAELSALRARVEQAERELKAARDEAGVLDGVTLADWLREELSAAADCREERDEARARVAELEAAIDGLIEYRDHNTLNFQLEKADDYINVLRAMTRSAQPATLTPRRCVGCTEAAKAMREAAASASENYNGNFKGAITASTEIAAAIRALPLQSCDGCNPLKTEDSK